MLYRKEIATTDRRLRHRQQITNRQEGRKGDVKAWQSRRRLQNCSVAKAISTLRLGAGVTGPISACPRCGRWTAVIFDQAATGLDIRFFRCRFGQTKVGAEQHRSYQQMDRCRSAESHPITLTIKFLPNSPIVPLYLALSKAATRSFVRIGIAIKCARTLHQP